MGHGTLQVFDKSWSELRCREDLDHIRPCFPRCQDLCRCEGTGDADLAVALAHRHQLRLKDRAHHKLRTGKDGHASCFRVQHTANPDDRLITQLFHSCLDSFNGSGRSHCDLQRPHPAFVQSPRDLQELIWASRPNDCYHTTFLYCLQAFCLLHGPSSSPDS